MRERLLHKFREKYKILSVASCEREISEKIYKTNARQSGMSDEPGVAPQRGADDRLGDDFRSLYQREAISEVLREI
jgi:hypothetical protein